jgi:hypothetical protein
MDGQRVCALPTSAFNFIAAIRDFRCRHFVLKGVPHLGGSGWRAFRNWFRPRYRRVRGLPPGQRMKRILLLC